MAETRAKAVYDGLVKWSRRGSAIYVSLLIVRWLTYDTPPTSDLQGWVAPVSVWARIPVDRATMALIATWYAFLTQLKIRWALWLPVYLAMFPPLWVIWHLIRLVSSPVFEYLKSFGESSAATDPAATKKGQWSFPKGGIHLALVNV